VHGYENANTGNLSRLLGLSVRVMCVPYFAWLLVGSVFADQLVSLVYGHSYSGYAVVTTMLLVKATIEGISSPLSHALQTLERANVVTLGLGIGTIVTLGAGSILILQMGLEGAAIAAVASSLANALFKWAALKRILRHPSPSVGPTDPV